MSAIDTLISKISSPSTQRKVDDILARVKLANVILSKTVIYTSCDDLRQFGDRQPRLKSPYAGTFYTNQKEFRSYNTPIASDSKSKHLLMMGLKEFNITFKKH